MIRALRAALLAAALCSLSVDVVDAQLTGSTVNVSGYFPDSSTVFANPGDRIVSAAIEYPAPSYVPYSASWQVDVTTNKLIITDTLGTGRPFAPASFNGFILSIVSGPSIVSATVDPSSGFAPASLTVESGNRVLANYQGVGGPPGMLSSIINLTVVPEPATIGLVAIGLVGLATRRRA
jgi:hypothetical protein